MALSYAELQKEKVWRDQVVPPNLDLLAKRLRVFYNTSAIHIGTRGDNKHLRGYHRSRRWIAASAHCSDRKYSVTETQGNRSLGNGDWMSALDITIPRHQLIPMCKRLDQAVRANLLEKITEWYGNDDGDNRVDGYNNIANRVASSDMSHLWHCHISIDRGRANDDHDDLYEFLTGTRPIPLPPPPPVRPPQDLEWTEKMIRSLPELRRGATGSFVRTAQGLIIARGLKVAVDGEFGPDMEAKTRQLQKIYGAEHLDGIWGPETWTIGVLGADLR